VKNISTSKREKPISPRLIFIKFLKNNVLVLLNETQEEPVPINLSALHFNRFLKTLVLN
jgi:hypothetical protein